MNRIEFNQLVDKRKELIESVLQKKGAEYSGDANVFHNFEEGAKMSFHSNREMVAWEYMTKHLQSIKDMISTNKPYSEQMIREKFGDAINYLILMEAMMLDSNGLHNRFCDAIKETKAKAEKKIEELRTAPEERGIDQMGFPKMSRTAPNAMVYPTDKMKLQQLPPNYDEWYYSSY
jgi:hypothetical protein